jgi:hypothetical protein
MGLTLGLACAGGTGNGGNGNGSEAEPIFPANYRQTYTLVRDCRNSIEHGSTVRVYVNSIGADAYVAEENPLPVGTMVVKEEYFGVACTNDDELAVWSAMVKQESGFDPSAGDWRFQEVASPSRNVTIDTKTTCIECHSAAECVARDFMCTE